MKRQIQRILLLLTVVLLTTALYGCTGGKENETNDTGSLPAQSDNSSPELPEGGSIVVGIQQDFDSLDPHIAEAAGTSEVLFNIFEGLVKPDTEGNLVPAVASGYKIAEDGKTYTFILRKGILFHTGEPVTVEDVKYSVERSAGKLEGQTQPLMSAYSGIESVNIVDSTTIEIHLLEADTELIGYLTGAIIPKEYEDSAKKPIGTGPFKFVSYSPQESLVLEANEDYWQEDIPYLDRVEFKIVANTDSAMMELKAKSIDVYPYLTIDQANELENEYDILIGTTNLVQALFLNNQVEPFNDVKVRQALNYAVDPKMIIDIVAGGNGTEIGSNMFPAFGKYFVEELKDVYNTDVAKAKELLSESGYPNGFEMTITVPSNYKFHIDTTQVIVEQLKQVGISAKIELVEWSSWLNDVYIGRDYQSTIIGLDAELAPKDLLRRYGSAEADNFVNFNNEEYDRVLESAISSILDEEKVTYYKRLQEILVEEAASVYIQDPALLVAVNKDLKGYTFYPVYVQDMSKLYFD